MVKYTREEKYSKPKNDAEFLELAIMREKASEHFYADMLKHNFSDEIKLLISGLMYEEKAHKDKLQMKLNAIRGIKEEK